MSDFLKIIQDEGITYQQQLMLMTKLAESYDHTINYNPELLQAKADGVICDLNEGNALYRPRYIIVDFKKFIKNGSKFLQLDPPKDLMEAVNHLLILYKHVPSVTNYPVYLGDFDDLLEEFVLKEDKAFAKKVLSLFLLNIDRTLSDSFVHANIGPKDTTTGRLILELTEEMQLAIPNLTLKYDADITSDEFATRAVSCMLKTSKPSFANSKMYNKDWNNNYAIASCYNGLEIGGGGFTLPRLKLASLAKLAKSPADFIENILPKYSTLMLEFMDQKIEFLVEETSFFKSNFLVTEGLLELDKFTGMFGLVGLAECANTLLNIENPNEGYGFNEEANTLAEKIMDTLESIVDNHDAKYAKAFNHKYRLHAQVGIDTDGMENSPGSRIPIGYEPEVVEQVLHSTRFHKYFKTGVGDIYKFEETWLNTPEALLDIIKGAFENNTRYFSGYLDSCDVVRVTGYLVKKSELNKLDANNQSLNQVSVFGQGARDNANALSRRVHK